MPQTVPFYCFYFAIIWIFLTLICLFTYPPKQEGITKMHSQVNVYFSFIILGFFSVSYTGSVISVTDNINLPNILAYISDNFFLYNTIQDIPRMPDKCVNIIDINRLKPNNAYDLFFAKDVPSIIGKRGFIYIPHYIFILKYKYLIFPFTIKICYNIICKLDIVKLCRQVGEFLALILRLLKRYSLPIWPIHRNYQVYSSFNNKYTYPTSILSARINHLYEQISSLLNDTRVRINQAQDYIGQNNIILSLVNSRLAISNSADMDQATFVIHNAHLTDQHSILVAANLSRLELINELRRLEVRVASENTEDVFHRSDSLNMQFDSIFQQYRSFFR